jgi:transcription-repair coupling factor (superfamily II helicase)
MKKLMFYGVIAFMMLSFIPSQSNAAKNTKVAATATAKSIESTDAAQLAVRLDEIKAMDKSTLSRSEKKELRNEVKTIKSTQDETYVVHHHHGIYLGVGGVLVVILIIVLIV